MARMAAWAAGWAVGGREKMWSRMSVVGGIERAVLEGGRGGRVLDRAGGKRGVRGGEVFTASV